MIYTNQTKARQQTGLSYLGDTNSSSKIEKNGKKGELTYVLYLAPANLSGYEVCPMRTESCTKACLHESGRNRIDVSKNRINQARINKTKLFFEQRKFFMEWIVDEISSAKKKAHNSNMTFSIRLNGTSDISPEIFKLGDKNILQVFPDVQFYDYTKVHNRIVKLRKYDNYDLTFSFSGYNWDLCEHVLQKNVSRVAMVFEKELPLKYRNYTVVNADETDMRYRDPLGVICGLKFKKVRNKIDTSNDPFIINLNDPDCQFNI